MPVKILYKDQDLLVIDKPAGISVHPGHGNLSQKTIVDLIQDQVGDTDLIRPGIVHRLDKGTSGVLAIARTALAKEALQSQFKSRKVEKVYLALVNGIPNQNTAQIDLPIGRHPRNPLKRAVKPAGKPALTTYRILKKYVSKDGKQKLSLLEVKPRTGRTHQIRVHLSYLGHPVVGDSLYGAKTQPLDRLWLHAHKLTINLLSGARKTFTSKFPVELKQFLRQYNSH